MNRERTTGPRRAQTAGGHVVVGLQPADEVEVLGANGLADLVADPLIRVVLQLVLLIRGEDPRRVGNEISKLLGSEGGTERREEVTEFRSGRGGPAYRDVGGLPDRQLDWAGRSWKGKREQGRE